MNKLLLMTMLSIPIVALADDQCTPNLINEDMCDAAKKFADNMKKALPITLSENLKITNVKSEKRRVIISASLAYNKDTLNELYDNDKYFYDKARKLSKKVTAKSVCDDSHTKAFVNLGGELEYEYYFKDGSIYDVTTITACYDGKNNISQPKIPKINPTPNNKNEPFTLPKNRGWEVQ